jgi:hypothetical protein
MQLCFVFVHGPRETYMWMRLVESQSHCRTTKVESHSQCRITSGTQSQGGYNDAGNIFTLDGNRIPVIESVATT